MSEADFDKDVRRVVYDVSMRFGYPPKAVEVAQALGASLPAVYESYQRLATGKVLVLQPVSIDRVRPVTGVVISASGLVIVPLDFAAPGDQIIILSIATDMAPHATPWRSAPWRCGMRGPPGISLAVIAIALPCAWAGGSMHGMRSRARADG